MKKSIFALATAVACMFAFSACTPEEEAQLLNAVNNSGIADAMGTIYIVPTSVLPGSWAQPNHSSVRVGDTIKFSSAMCDITTFAYEGQNVDPGVLFVAGNIQTTDSNVNINFPLMGINLRDSTHTVANQSYYSVSTATGNLSFVFDLDLNNWEYYLTHNDIQIGNMMIIAFSEEDYYVCYDGKIYIDDFAANGQMVYGTLSQVKAFYVKKSQLASLALVQSGLLYNLLPHFTFDGKIACHRSPWVSNVAAELEAQRIRNNE